MNVNDGTGSQTIAESADHFDHLRSRNHMDTNVLTSYDQISPRNSSFSTNYVVQTQLRKNMTFSKGESANGTQVAMRGASRQIDIYKLYKSGKKNPIFLVKSGKH